MSELRTVAEGLSYLEGPRWRDGRVYTSDFCRVDRPATPDGICLDAEGCVWFADVFGNRAVRVRQGGEIVDEVSAGDLGVFACMLGGADGRTLFLCAAPTFVEAVASVDHQARLLATTVEVPHAGLP